MDKTYNTDKHSYGTLYCTIAYNIYIIIYIILYTYNYPPRTDFPVRGHMALGSVDASSCTTMSSSSASLAGGCDACALARKMSMTVEYADVCVMSTLTLYRHGVDIVPCGATPASITTRQQHTVLCFVAQAVPENWLVE